MNLRRPLMLIVKEITHNLKQHGYSIRALENDLANKGCGDISRGKLIRLFYTSEKNQQAFLNSTDDTIEAVLTLLNITSKDLFSSIMNQYYKENNIYQHFEDNEELKNKKGFIEFLKNPDAMPYLKRAYKQYTQDQIREELEQIRKELEKVLKDEYPDEFEKLKLEEMKEEN